MPFKLVLTRSGSNEEVSVVPAGWVEGEYLYWPRYLKKHDIESLRSNEYSVPEKNWKKMKCKVKLSKISTYEEALNLEEIYSKLQDTEDEEKYTESQKLKDIKKKQHFDVIQLLDVNSEIEAIQRSCNNPDIMKPSTSTEVINSEEVLSIQSSDLLKIVTENTALQMENKSLKEEILCSTEFQNETNKNFAIMQTQLDKIFDLLQNKNQASSFIITNNTLKEDDEKYIGSLKFPIKTKEQLDALENKLLDKGVMAYLVNRFSQTSGTSGQSRITKFGITLMKYLIQDELLNQFTWKGIKGSSKMAFMGYVKIRELFYNVAHLADQTCSRSDSDLFIQNSAIKHSGQRLKRHISCSESKINSKKPKEEVNENESNKNTLLYPKINIVITEKPDQDKTIGQCRDVKENDEIKETKNNKITTDGTVRDINENDEKERTDGDLRNVSENNEEKDNSDRFENNKVTTDGNVRDINENDKKERTDGDLRNINENNEEKQNSNPEQQHGLVIKMKADDSTKSNITVLSDVKIRNKDIEAKDIKKKANISSADVSSIFEDLIKF